MKQLAEAMRRHVIEINSLILFVVVMQIKVWFFDSEYTPIRISIEEF